MKNKKQKINVNIMNKVDFCDLVDVRVVHIGHGHIQVFYEPIDRTKNVVVDPNALREINNQITKRTIGKDPRDPKVLKYIEEFVSKLTSELYRNGLVELDNAKEGKSDPYSDLRKMYSEN